MLALIGGELSQHLAGGQDATARVAATRRMSGQFRTITSSRILLPVNPIGSCGTSLGRTHAAV